MKNLNITFPNGKMISVPNGTSAKDVIENFAEEKKSILAVAVNNEVCSLTEPFAVNAHVRPVLNNKKEGSPVYRRSLCLLLAAASHNLFPETRLLVGHSLGHGYYYTLETGKPIEADVISSLEKEMRRIVDADIQIVTERISYEEAVALLEKIKATQARKQLNYSCPPYIYVNTLENFSDLNYGPVVPSTGYLKTFALKQYGSGFLLRFPTTENPDGIPDFHDQPKLFEVYKHYKEWGKKVDVTCVADLNEFVNTRKVNDFIAITETAQEKAIGDIADKIAARKGVRVVLIAGPSSSGKTTTSKKLELALRAIGYRPKVISLDCYYVGRDRNPKDENGNYDYECLEALDVELLNKNLVDLFAGKEVNIPSYDFALGQPFYEDRNKMRLHENDILIMEGIHGLNDKLTPLIAPELKFKVYISALTQLNLDDHNRIATSDNRLIRRIVRDANYRGKSAADTISMWPSVQRGEKLHIFPFQNNADAFLNTALDYELAALKVYAEPLLRCVSPACKEYSEACRLLSFLRNFSPIPPTDVPSRSIIREFIGGSAFRY